MQSCVCMADTVSTNITLDRAFWKRCKKVAIDRGISLNQLVKNGLKLALDDSDAIVVGRDGKISNDLKGAERK